MLATGKAAPAATASATVPHDRADARPRAGLVLDVVATLGVLVAAFAARWPYMYTAPRFRDDTLNALLALRIYRGQQLPFTDVEAYIGAFFNYAVAAGMLVIGPTIYAARIVVMWFGVATVGATYVLGRELGGPSGGVLVGLIAAAFYATNGIAIGPVGHVAFSGSMTPLFTTLAFWLLQRWAARGTGSTLAWAGFMLGMSMHTHPTIVAMLPGAAGFVLWRNLGVLRTRAPYYAIVAFAISFSPMIIYNVMTGGQSIRHAEYTATERPDYVGSQDSTLTPASYVARQKDYWLLLHGTLGGAVDERSGAMAYLADPLLAAISALGIAGLAWAAVRHRCRLPLWIGASFALILPIFNVNHYDVEYDGRYVLPLLPMIYACIGLLLVDLGRAARLRLGSPVARAAAPIVLGALVLVLAGLPLLSLARYYQRASRVEPTNQSLVRAMDDVKAALRPGDVVLLDWNLNARRLAPNADPLKDEASVFRVFRYIMEFDRVPYEKDPSDTNQFDDKKQTTTADEATLSRWAEAGQHGIVIMDPGFDSKDTAKLGDLIEQFGLTGLDGNPAKAPRPSERYGIFRFDPAGTGGRP
jgi:4-amino-4-deoxy-L-arabinose transferase-like glycosyltransferase